MTLVSTTVEDDIHEEIQRPAQNDMKFHGSAFPITEDFARAVYERSGISYDADIERPMTSAGIREALEKQILPALKHLRFTGINPMPEIHIIAPWSTTDDVGERVSNTLTDHPEVFQCSAGNLTLGDLVQRQVGITGAINGLERPIDRLVNAVHFQCVHSSSLFLSHVCWTIQSVHHHLKL